MKKYIFGMLTLMLSVMLCACGPSDEKVIEAQNKYREVINIHNQVVEAHAAIKDASLDDELLALEETIPEMESYNLNDMTDDEIDVLIDSMNTLIESYTTYLTTIGEIKANEDAAMLTPVYITLANKTDITFTKLSLEEKGDNNLVTDALETLSGLKPGQEMIGLTIYKDVDNTPWVLRLSDGTVTSDDEAEKDEEEAENSEEETDAPDNGMNYEFELDVSKFVSENHVISICVNEETSELYIE